MNKNIGPAVSTRRDNQQANDSASLWPLALIAVGLGLFVYTSYSLYTGGRIAQPTGTVMEVPAPKQ